LAFLTISTPPDKCSARSDYSDKSDNTEIIHDKIKLVKVFPNNKIAVEVGRELSIWADTLVCPYKAKQLTFPASLSLASSNSHASPGLWTRIGPQARRSE
jgi:hypothetical protein